MTSRKSCISLAVIFCLACVGAQLKDPGAAEKTKQIKQKTENKVEYIKLLLEELDERDGSNENATAPVLPELNLRIFDNSQNVVRIKFVPKFEEGVSKEVLDLVSNTLENVLIEAEQLGYPSKLYEENNYS